MKVETEKMYNVVLVFLVFTVFVVAFAATCEDSETWISRTPKKKRNCEWVGKNPNNNRCDKYKDDNGVKAADACAKSCGKCPHSQMVKFIEKEMKRSKMLVKALPHVEQDFP